MKSNFFYGHGSSITSIRDLVAYKNGGIKQNVAITDTQLAPQFGRTNLTSEEIDLLVDFLENALYDAAIERYATAAVLSGNCIPNNDPQSRIDIGCD